MRGSLELENRPATDLSFLKRGGCFVDLLDAVALRHHFFQRQMTIRMPLQERRKVPVGRTGTADTATKLLLIDQYINSI